MMLILTVCFAAAAVSGLVTFLLISAKRSEARRYTAAAEQIIEEELLEYSLKNPYTLAGQQKVPATRRVMVGIEPVGKKPKQRLVYDAAYPVTIGRGDSNQIVLHDGRISAQHAAVFYKNGSVWLRDCRSRYGVTVQRGWFAKIHLDSGRTMRLQDGDRLWFCGLALRVKLFVCDINR